MGEVGVGVEGEVGTRKLEHCTVLETSWEYRKAVT